MKSYLDTCSLQRPLDNKSQLRILLESEAVLGLLTLCDSAGIEPLSSEALLVIRAAGLRRDQMQRIQRFEAQPVQLPGACLNTGG